MTVHPLLKRAFKGVGEGALIVLITCVALEASLWVLAGCNKKFHWLTASALTDTLPDPVLGSRLSPDYPDHDKDGFRNAAVLSAAEVVAMGDSQTYGTNVAMDQAWPQQLGKTSGKSVYNMGVPGYGPVHSLILTPHAIEKHPQWIVSALYDGNDLYDAFRMSYLDRQHPELVSTDPSVLDAIRGAEAKQSMETIVERLSKISDGHFDAYAPGGESTARPSLKNRCMTFIKTYSKTWNIARNIRRTVLERESSSQSSLMGRIGWKAMQEKARNSSGYWVTFEHGSVRTVFMPSYREIALHLDDPRIAEGAHISEGALKASAAEAQAAHAKFAILMIPTKELSFYEAFSGSGDPVIQQLSGLAAEEQVFRAAFKRDVCGGQGIVCIDPLPALTAALKAGQSPYPMDSDGHPNPHGHAILAREVWKGLGNRD